MLPYLAMPYLYKKSNYLWHFLIKQRLTALVWRPLVEGSRRRHLRWRRQLAASETERLAPGGHAVIAAGL